MKIFGGIEAIPIMGFLRKKLDLTGHAGRAWASQ